MNFKILKNRNLLLFIFGQCTSSLGTNVLHFATAFYVLQISGSSKKFASIIALGMIPNLILGPIAGVIADRVNRKKLIIYGDFIRGIFDISLFIYSLFCNININILYVVVFFFSTCEVFLSPAFSTILPSIVKKDDLIDATSLKQTIGRIVSITSPLIGALIIKICGLGIILLLDGLTYLISAVSEIFIEIPPLKRPTEKTSFIKDIIEGFGTLFINKRITSLITNNILTNLFLLPFIFIGFPFIIIKLLGGSQLNYATVQSTGTIASILSIFTVSIAKKRYNNNQCISIGIFTLIFSCILTFLLLNNSFISLINHNSINITIFFCIAIFIFYSANSFFMVFYNAFYQTNIPSNLLGRFTAVEGLFITLARLIGLKLFGYVFDNYKLIIPLTILGIGIILKIFTHRIFINQ